MVREGRCALLRLSDGVLLWPRNSLTLLPLPRRDQPPLILSVQQQQLDLVILECDLRGGSAGGVPAVLSVSVAIQVSSPRTHDGHGARRSWQSQLLWLGGSTSVWLPCSQYGVGFRFVMFPNTEDRFRLQDLVWSLYLSATVLSVDVPKTDSVMRGLTGSERGEGSGSK